MQMAKENPGWGYDRIVGAMANLGHRLSDQTVGNILRRHDIPPAPKQKQTTSWKDFIRAHMAVLAATDFFTVSAEAERVDDLLCAVFHSLGKSEDMHGGDDAPSRSGMDGTDGAQCNDGGERFSGWPQVFTA